MLQTGLIRKLLLSPLPPVECDNVYHCQEPDYHPHCHLQCQCHIRPKNVTLAIPAASQSPACVLAAREAREVIALVSIFGRQGT